MTALGFDFTNGFHDTGNAMATSIATGALGPRTAVALSGVLNLVGAFLSLSVAATIASGVGVGKKGAEVRWNVARRMATAWLFTLPIAAVVGAASYGLAHVIGGLAGVIVDFAILIAIAAGIYLRSRRSAVSAHNVNDEWTGTVAPSEPQPAAV